MFIILYVLFEFLCKFLYDFNLRRRLASQMKLSEDDTRDLIGLPVKAGKTLSEQILIQTLTEKHNLSPTKSSSGKTNLYVLSLIV